jgi:hypothetical protein
LAGLLKLHLKKNFLKISFLLNTDPPFFVSQKPILLLMKNFCWNELISYLPLALFKGLGFCSCRFHGGSYFFQAIPKAMYKSLFFKQL